MHVLAVHGDGLAAAETRRAEAAQLLGALPHALDHAGVQDGADVGDALHERLGLHLVRMISNECAPTMKTGRKPRRHLLAALSGRLATAAGSGAVVVVGAVVGGVVGGGVVAREAPVRVVALRVPLRQRRCRRRVLYVAVQLEQFHQVVALVDARRTQLTTRKIHQIPKTRSTHSQLV